jgi:hypothetical protein
MRQTQTFQASVPLFAKWQVPRPESRGRSIKRCDLVETDCKEIECPGSYDGKIYKRSEATSNHDEGDGNSCLEESRI